MSNGVGLLGLHSEVTIIVSIGDIPGYVCVAEDGNINVVSDIKESTKWSSYLLEEPCQVLNKVREIFPNLQFVATRVPSVIFGNKPRRLIKEGK